VIKAFNNIYTRIRPEKGVAPRTPGQIALPVAGDSKEARDAVLRLVDEIGSSRSTTAVWTTPGGSSPEHRPSAGISR